jgi:hypothetical protein
MTFGRHLWLTIALCGVAWPQDQFRTEIGRAYDATFSAMREAKTKADIEQIVDAIDVPEWQGSLPSGAIMTRSDAIAALTGLLSVPPERRPVPRLHMLYTTETGWRGFAVYWVYRQSGNELIGSLARDTWVRTPRGWRRMRHEKLFPDRLLVQDGKGSILPVPSGAPGLP